MNIKEALKLKRINGLNWDQFAEGLPIKGNSLRVAFNRKSVPIEYLELIYQKHSPKSAQTAQLNEPLPIYNKTDPIHQLIKQLVTEIVEPRFVELEGRMKYLVKMKDNNFRVNRVDEMFRDVRKEIELIREDISKMSKLG